MHRTFLLLIIICFSILISCHHEARKLTTLPLIPCPQQVEPQQGSFIFADTTTMDYAAGNPEVQAVADFLNELVQPPMGHRLPHNRGGSVRLILDERAAGVQGTYTLSIQQDRIEIRSASAVGLFYGIQTLRQLLPAEIERRQPVSSVWSVPCVQISDAPRFSYRGMHLDVGRHFFPVSFIKKYIDLLALHKMNMFHWHLTEDQGWRIEIKKYPRLTEVGAYRAETLIGHGGRPPFEYDGQRYGGFYTQDQIREVVRYAQSRFVTIIPEIEMPGHSSAALAAYPELGCTGGPYQVQTRWGVFNDVYCAGNDRVFEFLEDVLDEVVELFPGKYIHIGGDECPKKSWQNCEKCQARIKAEGLKDEHELQSYFIRRIEKYLLSKGRYIIGWDEILEGGLAPQATVMSWRGMDGGIAAARQNHDVIMTPGTHCYFDHYQADPATQPLAIGGFTPLKKVYSFEPVPDELTAAQQKHILGAQGNVWTEYMKTSDHVEYMVFPRATALAEVLWAQKEQKDYGNFLRRLEQFSKRLDELKVNYFKEGGKPVSEVKSTRTN